MSSRLIWFFGMIASTLLHVCAAGIYLMTHELGSAPAQSGKQSELQLDTVVAERQDAIPQELNAEKAQVGYADTKNLDSSIIPQTKAKDVQSPAASPKMIDNSALIVNATVPSAPSLSSIKAFPKAANIDLNVSATIASSVTKQPALNDVNPRSEQLNETNDYAVPLIALAPQIDTLSTSIAKQPTLAEIAPTSDRVRETIEKIPSLPVLVPKIDTALVLLASQPALADVNLRSDRISESNYDTELLAVFSPKSNIVPSSATSGTPTLPLVTARDPTPAAQLPTTSSKAVTAYEFQDRIVSDPKAIATIQAFMAPTEESAQDVKDDLSDVLTGIDCARLSATFIPETGSLEMRGHIPDLSMRDTILATMQAKVGDGIKVTENLLHLPSPQCGALTGISAVGLPQSTDQFTNRRLIGDNAHARKYNYSEGQRLQFDLAAPDYDAYVYVDYFASDGSVIHLIPNDKVALSVVPAESLIGIGTDSSSQSGLKITIGPPFGQEIAVAFAASKPLYKGLRPIVEPATPYLEELKEFVSRARASDPDFKGEWVYFFIKTTPAIQ